MTREQDKFYKLKHTSDYKVVGDDIDYKVFIDDEYGEVVLQFEESDSRADWVNNLLFIPWPVKLGTRTAWTTYGYARAYASAGNEPLHDFINAIIAAPLEYKTVIRGWSFGSAMAKLAARHFFNVATRNLDELTTYGDVKCWLNPFYKNKAKRLREYVTSNDAVTYCVPFYHRDKTCRVGACFKLRELFNTEYYHTHYEEYDYSEFEGAEK